MQYIIIIWHIVGIWIYKDINGTQGKRNYDDKVPVQIKGHIDKNREYIGEHKITYSVDLENLEVYFQDRGVLFFEVFMEQLKEVHLKFPWNGMKTFYISFGGRLTETFL